MSTILSHSRSRSARDRAAERGATLIEAMVAGAVFAIGLLGLLAAQTVGAKQNWMASREARAAAIAMDAANSVRRWPYPSLADTRLDDIAANNEAELVSGTMADRPDPADFEHDLNADSGFVAPLPNAAIDYNRDDAPDFMRLLHVSPIQVGPETVGIMVSVVVAWREDLGYRQVVIPIVKYDPSFNNATVPGI
jgi:hypothetical protein